MKNKRELIAHCFEDVPWHNSRHDLRFPLPTTANESLKWPRWIEEQKRLVDRSLHRVDPHSECREDSVLEHWRSCSSMCGSMSLRCSSLSVGIFLNDQQLVRWNLRCFFSTHTNWSIESFNWVDRVGSSGSDDSFGSSIDSAKKKGLARGRRARRGEDRKRWNLCCWCSEETRQWIVRCHWSSEGEECWRCRPASHWSGETERSTNVEIPK